MALVNHYASLGARKLPHERPRHSKNDGFANAGAVQSPRAWVQTLPQVNPIRTGHLKGQSSCWKFLHPRQVLATRHQRAPAPLHMLRKTPMIFT